MIEKPMRKQIENTLEYTFKILFLLYAIFSSSNITYGTRIISFIMWPMILIGGLLLLLRLKDWKMYRAVPSLWVLLLFLGSFVLSMLVNSKYGFMQNVISLIFMTFYFLLLYAQSKERGFESMKKEFSIMSYAFLIYMALAVVISFGFMLTGYWNVIKLDDGYEVISGFIWGRLWGVFLDPNPAASMACIAIFLSLYFFLKSKSKVMKSCYVINILLQLLYMALSDSRTGTLCIGISAGFFVYSLLYKKNRGKLKVLQGLGILLLVCATTFIAAALPKTIEKAYNQIQSVVLKENNKEIDRGYDLENDPSNRRFDIWKSGIDIFKENVIFGTSFNGIKPYAKDKMPDAYIINNTQTEFQDMHNELLNILVAQGVLGAIVAAVLIIQFLIYIMKNYFRVRQERFLLVTTLMTVLVCIGVGSMFVARSMFYANLPSSNIFWMFLGYLVVCLREDKGSKQEKES